MLRPSYYAGHASRRNIPRAINLCPVSEVLDSGMVAMYVHNLSIFIQSYRLPKVLNYSLHDLIRNITEVT
jgi:hypothetical protein